MLNKKRGLILYQVYKKILNIEEWLTAIFLMIIVALVFVGSLCRFLGFPLNWTTDIAQLLFVWICFLGIDILLKLNKHISVDIVFNRFSRKIQRILTLFNYIIIGSISLFIIIFGAYISLTLYSRTFNTLKISYSFATASMPFGGILMFLTIIQKIKETMAQK